MFTFVCLYLQYQQFVIYGDFNEVNELDGDWNIVDAVLI